MAASQRVVPLHRAVIDAGFLDYVRERGDRPLFYRAKRGVETKHPSKGASNRVAAWVSGLFGFGAPWKTALHACHHAFKSSGVKLEIADSLIDAIQGHAEKSSAGTYRHFTMAQMATAIAHFPVPALPKVEPDGSV